jgi:hypothetical protein
MVIASVWAWFDGFHKGIRIIVYRVDVHGIYLLGLLGLQLGHRLGLELRIELVRNRRNLFGLELDPIRFSLLCFPCLELDHTHLGFPCLELESFCLSFELFLGMKMNFFGLEIERLGLELDLFGLTLDHLRLVMGLGLDLDLLGLELDLLGLDTELQGHEMLERKLLGLIHTDQTWSIF